MASQFNTAEGGTNGTTPTTADTGSGDALGIVTPGSVSIVQYSSSHPAHGGMGYKLANHTATAEIATIGQLDSAGGAASVFGAFYYTCDVTPTGTLRVMRVRKSGGANVGNIVHLTSNLLQIRTGSDGSVYSFTHAMTAGTLYRVEWNVVVNGTASATLQARMYSGDSTTLIEDSGAQTVTATATVSAVDRAEYGQGTTSTSAWPDVSTGAQYFDDLKAFYTDWPGPAATPHARTLLGVGA